MTLEHTLSDLTQRLEDWQTRGINEAQTAQAIVLRILQALGYDIWNPFEVLPEASNNSGYRPDYTIQLDGDIRFIIEVKALGKTLSDADKEQTQAVNYINVQGKRWAILTNGREWLFFDNHRPVEITQKRVLTLDLVSHAKQAADYFGQLLARKHWQKDNAEMRLGELTKAIDEDIQKRIQLEQIERKLRIQLGQGYARSSLGLKKTIGNELDANERKLADTNFDELAERILGIPSPQPPAPVNDVERAIIDGIIRSRKYTSDRGGADVQAWLGHELLEATSWRDIHAGLAEAMIALEDAASLTELTQIFDDVTEKRKGDGTTYPSSGYRQLSNGRFIFLHASAIMHQKRILDLLTHLNVTPQHLKVTYRGKTFYLP